MVQRYLELYPAILLYTSLNPGMNIPIVSDKQYKVLQDICSVLSILHSAQELLSAEKTPTLALALPVYEALIDALENATSEFPQLRHAIRMAIGKLVKYVDKARDLPVYALAMAVNPGMKFRWFDEHQNCGPTCQQQACVVTMEAMLEVQQKRHISATQQPQSPLERASQAQRSGFQRLLTIGSRVHRAPNTASGSQNSSTTTQAPDSTTPLSSNKILIANMRIVEAELLRWEQYEWTGSNTLGTVNLVEFWKAHRHVFPLFFQVAMNVLPAQVSSVSSERAFSSSKFTCTPERNKISEEHMEYLQVLKHSLHRCTLTHKNNQTLDFMARIVDPDGDMHLLN
ncbi:unnamed protein product [Rhizoctonia solani]|uniref:HAT C-terminal dimerisation domain-containing protein n=1 Tax=Rhizoctonia solani TaxID=456999 RepID=A0A8H2WYB1_9AGAM|nr:unnamed protein product [Rhizoctonia solani]